MSKFEFRRYQRTEDEDALLKVGDEICFTFKCREDRNSSYVARGVPYLQVSNISGRIYAGVRSWHEFSSYIYNNPLFRIYTEDPENVLERLSQVPTMNDIGEYNQKAQRLEGFSGEKITKEWRDATTLGEIVKHYLLLQ
ncbi:hypothetical protein HZB02_03350 [Candidatus Woesearchaeota archaeon]|nr:hypothetical protein [Candidatus Woesearchaeota archaeon]